MEEKKMKTVKYFLMALSVMAMLIGCGSKPVVPNIDELDLAIRDTSNYLNESIPVGNKIVILNIQSEFPDLSDYIIDELIANAVNDRVFSVVDRQQLDIIRAEQNFQYSGEVDDSSAQEIGRLLGAQTIVSGAVSRLGTGYRMRIRALEVQTAQVQGQFNRNITSSPLITKITGTTPAVALAATLAAARQTTPAALAGGGTPAPAATQQRVTPLRWSIEEFKDQFGDGTGRYYMEFDGQITANYSDVWGSQRATITNFRFSRSVGLEFRSSRLESFTDWNAEIFLKNSLGDEKRFRGRALSTGRTGFNFSDELADYLQDPEIKALLVVANSRYQFDFPPRFKEAYELLLTRDRR
jgi:TolB-like protein